MVKALLTYPSYPETFWSFKYALPFVGRKAAYPPLGLLTVASLLPETWEKKLVDLNVRELTDDHLRWADVVLISAMDIQAKSAGEIIRRCRNIGVKVVAGGPLFTSRPDEFPEADHLILGEGEGIVEEFAKDFERGRAKRVYRQNGWVSLASTPVPSWDLISSTDYASLSIQFSRGCPYDCEFCDVTALFGRNVRTKTPEQILSELDAIYETGWKGGVFFVDDNFIGNRRKVKTELLPAVIRWMEEKSYPFDFITQVSVNVADDEELMTLLARAGFDELFIGIESPDDDSLMEANKWVNRNRDLVQTVKKIHKNGFLVHAGFIVGFDTDKPSIFDRLIEFIEASGIPVAMVGLLNAPRGTRLYDRLKKEGRIISDVTGDNTDFSINFIPSMDLETLISGYRRIVETIYTPSRYAKRLKEFIKECQPIFPRKVTVPKGHVKAFIKSLYKLGIFDEGRAEYWKTLIWTSFIRPKLFPLAVRLLIYGYHFRKVFQRVPERVSTPHLEPHAASGS